MREVRRDEFFKRMNPLDVHPKCMDRSLPYTFEWKLRFTPLTLIGKTITYSDGGTLKQRYFLS